MQTRDKKRNFFGGYRHGNRSMPKLTGHTRQKSTTDEKEQEVDNESKKKTQIEKALEKANTAVLFDSANNFKSACLSYKEAVTLLQDVLLADPFRNDRPRLQNICDTYNERIRVLSKSIDPSPTITPTSPTKITDTTTKTSTKTTTTTAKTNTNTTKDTLLENSGVNDMRAITEGLSTSASSSPSSSWRLGKGGKRRAKSRPTSMVHDESDDAASAYTVDSTKTTTSLFTSLFAKKGLNAKHNKENPTMQHHDLSSSVTLNSGPKPSKSTPIAPFSRSPRTWLPQADRKKRHSSDSMDKQGNEQLPPPSLPLPELSSTPNNQEDYFDLGSLGASDLLLNAPSSRYSALHTTTATTKATTTKNDGREGGREKNGQDNNHYKNRVNQYVGIDLILEEDPTNMNDTMDMLAKVMNESNHDDMGDTTCSSEDTSTAPLIVPPPRKQSITSTKQTTTTEKDHRDDYYFLSTVEEEHCSKSSSSAGSTTTSSSLSLPSTTSSPPLAPVPCPSTSSSTNNNNNNGQGLSSFWRAHTFSTRRSAHSSSAQSPPQSPPPSSSSSLSSRKKNNNKKHEPSLPPLHLPKNSNNNHPPPPANSSRASSTRTRSTSNASAKSRQSVASASSPTTLSSPSSQSSNRNGWSSFDLQSRSNNYNNNNNNPPSSLFNASVASLALSPKERTQFFDPPKIDPAVFLSEPEPKAGVNDLPLTQRILKCLVEGGYLTDRLYVPKQLWSQTNIRLPSVDAKLAACEVLIPVLERMNAIQNESMVLSETTKEISALENVLEHIKEGFARKLKLYDRKNDTNGDEMAAIVAACEGSNNNPSQSTTPSSANNITASSSSSSTTTNNPSNKTSQTFAAWGNKLSKSVERMKLESSRTSEHQHSTYIQALIQVFTLAQVLDSWRMQYTEIIGRVPHDKVLSYAMFLTRLQACTETLEKIVCAFVLRDVTLLVHKWIKRSREWSLE